MTVYLQVMDTTSSRLGKEESAIYQHALMENLKVVRWALPAPYFELSSNDLVVGNIPGINQVLTSQGKPIPDIGDYPESLKGYLKRNIVEMTASELLYTVGVDEQVLFAKPKELKLFTGQVFTPTSGMALLRSLEPHTPLYVSQVVDWLAEFRVYVLDGSIVACCRYDDSEDELEPCMDTIHEAIATLEASGEFPIAYGLDFGVLKDGATALIEANDAYALGKYKGISEKDYFRFLKARWDQLMQ